MNIQRIQQLTVFRRKPLISLELKFIAENFNTIRGIKENTLKF